VGADDASLKDREKARPELLCVVCAEGAGGQGRDGTGT
jgi:hypothetical protein